MRLAGNGLLHRGALLGRGLAFACAIGADASGLPTGTAAEPLVDAEWSATISDRRSSLRPHCLYPGAK
jgi:hypothetical protein